MKLKCEQATKEELELTFSLRQDGDEVHLMITNKEGDERYFLTFSAINDRVCIFYHESSQINAII